MGVHASVIMVVLAMAGLVLEVIVVVVGSG